MFSTITDFLTIWEMETSATIACFENLTDESLQMNLVQCYRSIEDIANHIIDSANDIPREAKLPVLQTKRRYQHVGELIDAYTLATEKVKQAVVYWRNETLQEEVPMYGQIWKKGFVLWVTIAHQSHHRGQLTVLMRSAGLKVPGVYGPSKEEWQAMGLPAGC